MPKAWTVPSEIEAKLWRLWNRGHLLGANQGGLDVFPLSISLTYPSPEDLSNRFDEVKLWILQLEAGAKAARGFGYVIVATEINNRRIGRNNLPTSITFTEASDALRYLGKIRDAETFHSLSALTLQKIPELGPWLLAKPMKLLDHADKWERVLAVLLWLRSNPGPKIYVRQMDVAGVDTKFIESCEGILVELFRAMTEKGDEAVPLPKGEGKKSFEERFGFLSRPALIRFRILDPRLHIQGLADLSAPINEVAALSLPVKRVFITENNINGLAFPPHDESLVLFGLGYGVDTLSALPWLQKVQIIYWGDIDTHGFAILDRLRISFPECQSLLMDRQTLMAHQGLWVEEKQPTQNSLTRLTAEESSLFQDLKLNRIQNNLRLEQERIGFKWLETAIGNLNGRNKGVFPNFRD